MLDHIRNWLHCRKYKQDYQQKWPELPVKSLVYYNDDPDQGTVIVFIDWSGDLDWQRDDKAVHYASEKGHDCHVSEILNATSALEPYVRNWPKDLKLSAKRVLGEAIARVFRCDYANGQDAIKKAKRFIIDKSREVSRYWTLQACTASATVAGALGVAAIWQSALLAQVFGRTPYLLFLAACAGAIGALLSIILRLGKLSFDASAERRLHYAEGVTRIVAGGISGILIGALVKLGVFLPVFSQAGLTTTAICAAALIAGASERLVPTIIAKVESTDPFLNGDQT
jgi:hypothetical protein